MTQHPIKYITQHLTKLCLGFDLIWSYRVGDTSKNATTNVFYHRLFEEDEESIATTPIGIDIPNIECVQVRNKGEDKAEIIFENGRIVQCELMGIRAFGPTLDRNDIQNNIWMFLKCSMV